MSQSFPCFQSFPRENVSWRNEYSLYIETGTIKEPGHVLILIPYNTKIGFMIHPIIIRNEMPSRWYGRISRRSVKGLCVIVTDIPHCLNGLLSSCFGAVRVSSHWFQGSSSHTVLKNQNVNYLDFDRRNYIRKTRTKFK